MENGPPAASQDLEHLKLLQIFHYVVAGITFLCFSFPLFHVVFGILIATGGMGGSHEGLRGGPPPAVFGMLFAAVGCAIVAFGWTLAVLMIAAGRCIAKRRRHTFCVIVAGLSCLLMPFGTVLGVFTLIVLMKPQVKALFEPPAVSTPA
jgi:hypothetical protein